MKKRNYYQIHLNKHPRKTTQQKNEDPAVISFRIMKIAAAAIAAAQQLVAMIHAQKPMARMIQTKPIDPNFYFNPGEIGVECIEDKNGNLIVIHQGMRPNPNSPSQE